MKEEVFEDGCHYERSFLYHSIILEMLLDIKNIGFEVPDLDVNLKKMEKVLFSFVVDGKIPLFNDAAYDIALDPEKLFQYCEKLGIKQSFGKDILFPAGNFAVLKCGELILHVDGGGMVSYQPGHMHASALSFEIYKDGKKMITDRGCLTYLPGKDRSFTLDGRPQHNFDRRQRSARNVGRFSCRKKRAELSACRRRKYNLWKSPRLEGRSS